MDVIFSNNGHFTPEITGVIRQSNVNFIISCTVHGAQRYNFSDIKLRVHKGRNPKRYNTVNSV